VTSLLALRLPDAAFHAVHNAVDTMPRPRSRFERDRWRTVALAACLEAAPHIEAPLREHIEADHATLRRLSQLHRPDTIEPNFCTECGHCWPCLTARILTGAAPEEE
jgi:hypothetical protein